MHTATTSWRRRWPLLLSAGLCAAAYLPRLDAPLVWDDRSVIAQNAALDGPIPLKDFFTRRYFEFSGEQSWRPLATASYAGLVSLFGKSPAALRGFHLLLHCLNAWLLSLLVAALGLGEAAGVWAAALFLIHAAHTETLFCVAFNEEILVSLGLLAMLLAHRRKKTGAAALALSFALLSKETGVIGLPLAFLGDLLDGGKPLRRRRDYALYCVPIAAYLFFHFGPMKGPASGIAAFALPGSQRLYFGLASLATAIRVFIAPIDLKIEYFAVYPDSFAQALLLAAGGVVALAAWAWLVRRAWRRERGLAFFLLWPAPFLLLTSPLWPVTVFNTRLFAERWLYLPALGLAAALAVLLRKRPAWGAVLLLFWGACGIVRAKDWSQESRLWTTLLDEYPWCAKAEEGLGESRFRRGDYGGALEAFERALFLRENRQDRLLAFYAPLSDGHFVAWESPSLRRWLGHAQLKLGHIKEADEQFQQAAALDPSDGFLYRIAAYSWAENGDFGKAGSWLSRGLAVHPEDPFLQDLGRDIARRKLSRRVSFD
ncbi:MAG: hypothetical protein HY077_06310 [Elusimicrobia bacterium]|nr:hypothetical protein [Elusimicrobiota bacterium]